MMSTVLFCAVLLTVDANVAVPGLDNYTDYNNKNCWDGHGAINIDTRNTASPPAYNITLQACLHRCDETGLDRCPLSCDCVVFSPNSHHLKNPTPETVGTCYRRSKCKLEKCMSVDNMFVFAKKKPPVCPTTPKPPPTSRNLLYIVV